MRILVSFAVVVGLTAIGTPFVHAQPAGPSMERKADKSKRAIRNVSGKVRSAGANIVVVTGRDKGKEAEWTFAIDPTTHIRRGRQTIVASDLKPGDAVQVRYLERDGKAQAESILVKGPRK